MNYSKVCRMRTKPSEKRFKSPAKTEQLLEPSCFPLRTTGEEWIYAQGCKKALQEQREIWTLLVLLKCVC